jgi:hypothetical protein
VRNARGRLLASYTDEQLLAAACHMRGLKVGVRQSRAWKGRRGPTWDWWNVLSREQKLEALRKAGQKPHRSPEVAAEAAVS